MTISQPSIISLIPFPSQVCRFPKANDFLRSHSNGGVRRIVRGFFFFFGVHATGEVNLNTLNYLHREADPRDFKRCAL